MLQTCLLYFTTVFQHEWVVKAMERSRKQHLEGYNPYAVAARIRELEDEMGQLRLEISPIYSEIILKYSTYEKPQQDRMFFELLYETLINIMDEAFTKLSKRPEIENEIGQLFRSKHFNLYKRKHVPPRSVDTLSVKELYTLKHETSNRALNAKMLSSLYEKPSSIGVTVASVTNTPLITQYVMSPIVARSMMKDPDAKRSLFKSIAKEGKPEMRRDVSVVFKSAAMLKGIDPTKLASELGSMQMSAEAQAAMGLISADKAWKSDRIKAPTGIVAPEAAGLPVDDAYNHLALLKRYILYGPQMGLAAGGIAREQANTSFDGRQSLPASNAGQAASSQMMGSTGPAAPGTMRGEGAGMSRLSMAVMAMKNSVKEG